MQDNKLQANINLKQLLKSKGFRWKTVVNDKNTSKRYELMECNNTGQFKD